MKNVNNEFNTNSKGGASIAVPICIYIYILLNVEAGYKGEGPSNIFAKSCIINVTYQLASYIDAKEAQNTPLLALFSIVV